MVWSIENVMHNVEADYIHDLAIASYELPFPLADTSWEMVEKIHQNYSLMRLLEFMEDTVWGEYFELFRNHFFEGHVTDYILGAKYVIPIATKNYFGLARGLIELSYLKENFLLNFFDFSRFLFDGENQTSLNELQMLGIVFLDTLVEEIHDGKYQEYLKIDEMTIYLQNQFNVLETEAGFFVDDRKLSLYLHHQLGKKAEFETRFREILKAVEAERKIKSKDNKLKYKKSSNSQLR